MHLRLLHIEHLLKDKLNENCVYIVYYRKGAKKQKEVLKELKEMFNFSAIFEIDSTTNVLMVRFPCFSYTKNEHILYMYAYFT